MQQVLDCIKFIIMYVFANVYIYIFDSFSFFNGIIICKRKIIIITNFETHSINKKLFRVCIFCAVDNDAMYLCKSLEQNMGCVASKKAVSKYVFGFIILPRVIFSIFILSCCLAVVQKKQTPFTFSKLRI